MDEESIEDLWRSDDDDEADDQPLKLSELGNFSDKQKEADEAVDLYKYTLYGGAVAGGKSYFLRWKLLKMLLRWFSQYDIPNIEVGLFCEDYPTLKDRQLSKIVSEFGTDFGMLHDDHKAHGKCFILHPEYGNGIIKFRNLDDPSKYQSAEFAAIAVDELTKNQKPTFLDLKHRLRWPGIEDTRFFAGTNPGSIGHAWVKKLWMDRDFEPEELEESEQYKYVKALASDNPHIAQSYLKQLDSLPPEMRKALRDGDWDIFKGQFFSEWRRSTHVIPRMRPPVEWKKFLCGDYGFSAPSAVYWCAVSPDNVLHVYRELYRTGLTYEQLTKEIVAMTPDDERLEYWVFDPAIWARSGASEQSLSGADIIEQTYTRMMKDQTGRPRYLRLLKGDNQRIIGWGLMRDRLRPKLTADGEVHAGLQFTEDCVNAIRTIPGLVYDKTRVEDCDSDGEDHAADSIRYGIMSAPTRSRTKAEEDEIAFRRKIKENRRKMGLGIMTSMR